MGTHEVLPRRLESLSAFKVEISRRSITLNGQVNQFPPLRMAGTPMSSKRSSTNWGQLLKRAIREPLGTPAMRGGDVFVRNLRPERDRTRIAFVYPIQGVWVTSSHPCSILLGSFDGIFNTLRKPQRIASEVGRYPMCGDLAHVCVMRRELFTRVWQMPQW